MSFSPLNTPGNPPTPSQTTQANALPRPGAAPGQRLYDRITEVYTWYISNWYAFGRRAYESNRGDLDEQIRRTLTHIKRIADVSLQGGDFLTRSEEERTLAKLGDLIEDVSSGQTSRHELPDALARLTSELTSKNPKAKLVFQATELEYLLCINPIAGQPADLTASYEQMLSQIIRQITPQMPDHNASAISQGLAKILEQGNRLGDLNYALYEAIKRWI